MYVCVVVAVGFTSRSARGRIAGCCTEATEVATRQRLDKQVSLKMMKSCQTSQVEAARSARERQKKSEEKLKLTRATRVVAAIYAAICKHCRSMCEYVSGKVKRALSTLTDCRK